MSNVKLLMRHFKRWFANSAELQPIVGAARPPPSRNRREKIVGGIALAEKSGIEFGAQCNPIVFRSEGQITYVDHLDTEGLKFKYRDDPNVVLKNLVDVDVVWTTGDLSDLTGLENFDYAIASHVLEHVPDMLGWLQAVESVLKPGGELRLALPDRRFTFDHHRSETQFPDILSAYILKVKNPPLRQVLDHYWGAALINHGEAWRSNLDVEEADFAHSVPSLIALGFAAAAGEYLDVHCWVFTARSFAGLMLNASISGLTNFECAHFHDVARSDFEFVVHLRKSDCRADISESWKTMMLTAAVKAPGEIPTKIVVRHR